jgi:hypothetical protein
VNVHYGLLCHILNFNTIQILRRIFGPKREEVAEGWRRVYNEELPNLCTSQSIIRVSKSKGVRWAGNVAFMGEMRNACKILAGKPEEKRPLRRPRHRWEVNIRMDLREIGWKCVECIHLSQNRDQCWPCMNMERKLWVS